MVYKKQCGVTLLELTVVLLILIALAGLAVPYVGGTAGKALCDATDVTMANVKRTIMDRYYLDTLGAYPVSAGGADYSLKYLFISGGRPDYDPDTQVGWRGPYLTNSAILAFEADLMTNLASAAGTYVHSAFADGDAVVLDAWGRPIVLQVNGSVARLVSAGPGSGLGISGADIDTGITDNRQADDRILYLNAPTPAADVNPRCD